MAVVITSITPSVDVFPFKGYFDLDADKTAAARAEVKVFWDNEAVALVGAGDNQLVKVQVNLPRNFAYCLVDAAVAIKKSAATTYNFDLTAESQFSDATTVANRTVEASMRFDASAVGTIDDGGLEGAIYHPAQIFSGVLIPQQQSQCVFIWRVFNSTANDTAYTCGGNLRFLQFDISQANHLAVNSAIPTR